MIDSKKSLKITAASEVTEEGIAAFADYLSVTVTSLTVMKDPAVAIAVGIVIRQVVRKGFVLFPTLFNKEFIKDFFALMNKHQVKSSKPSNV